MLSMLTLISRSPEYVAGYREYCQEFSDHHVVYFRSTKPADIDEAWFARTKEWSDKEEAGLLPGKPRSIHYWAVDDGKFIGEFQLRPEMTEDVMNGIGSIIPART